MRVTHHKKTRGQKIKKLVNMTKKIDFRNEEIKKFILSKIQESKMNLNQKKVYLIIIDSKLK